MKRWLCAVMVLLILAVGTAYAEETDWKAEYDKLLSMYNELLHAPEVYEDGCTLTYLDGGFFDYYGTPMVTLYFEYENNSGVGNIAAAYADFTVFQNGVQLSLWSGEDTEDAVSCYTEVQSGYKAKTVFYYYADDDSPITVEYADGRRFIID